MNSLNMFRTNSPSDELFLHFFFEISESDGVFNYLHDSNSIFRAGGIKELVGQDRSQHLPTLATTFSIPLPESATAWLTSASTASPDLVLGSSPSRTPKDLTSLPSSFESASAVASVCPSGPWTLNGHFVDRSWTRWGDHALACGCGGDPVITLFETSSIRAANDRANLASVLVKTGPFGPPGPH